MKGSLTFRLRRTHRPKWSVVIVLLLLSAACGPSTADPQEPSLPVSQSELVEVPDVTGGQRWDDVKALLQSMGLSASNEVSAGCWPRQAPDGGESGYWETTSPQRPEAGRMVDRGTLVVMNVCWVYEGGNMMSIQPIELMLVVLVIAAFVGVIFYWYRRTPPSPAEEKFQKLKSERQREFGNRGGISGFLSGSGRIGRLEWVIIHIMAPLLGAFAGVILMTIFSGISLGDLFSAADRRGILETLVDLVTYAPMTAIWLSIGTLIGSGVSWIADVRRLHDMGQSGWFSLLRLSAAIPFVGWIIYIFYFLWLLFSAGDPYTNKYGFGPRGKRGLQPAVPIAAPTPSPDPMSELKMRLAHGEITVEEFSKISAALNNQGTGTT